MFIELFIFFSSCSVIVVIERKNCGRSFIREENGPKKGECELKQYFFFSLAYLLRTKQTLQVRSFYPNKPWLVIHCDIV